MRHVDLCSGIGGFALGFEWAGLSEPVMFCDTDVWCRKILKQHWPDVPITEDVKELASEPRRYVPDCDILTAGYPCQPFSVAGKQKGAEDDRHIWPYIRKIVASKRPAWCVFENVYGHIALGLDQVLADLEAEGYATRAFVVPACGVDAHHKRDRIWIIAHTNSEGESDGPIHEGQRQGELVADTESIGRHGWDEEAERAGQTHQPDQPRPELRGQPGGFSETMADTESQRVQGFRASWEQKSQTYERQALSLCRGERPAKTYWEVEPRVGRVVDGIPRRVDRIKGLGNAIVPQIAHRIGNTIKEYERSTST
jgi:DNA (cytosine-5)-methyltransferase 1